MKKYYYKITVAEKHKNSEDYKNSVSELLRKGGIEYKGGDFRPLSYIKEGEFMQIYLVYSDQKSDINYLNAWNETNGVHNWIVMPASKEDIKFYNTAIKLIKL